MYRLRLWSVRQAKPLAALYRLFECLLGLAYPLIRRAGHNRMEPLVLLVERPIKELLFDCRMCGACALNRTGMSCPMNCPKQMRNGPCGGVRPDGGCEVQPDMACVWVAAIEGNRRIGRDPAPARLPALDWRLQGSSAWLNEAQRLAEQRGADG
jgi:hypothetical protein